MAGRIDPEDMELRERVDQPMYRKHPQEYGATEWVPLDVRLRDNLPPFQVVATVKPAVAVESDQPLEGNHGPRMNPVPTQQEQALPTQVEHRMKPVPPPGA